MFGGVGLFLGKPMIALIAYDTLFLKADATSKPRFLAAGGRPFTFEARGKEMITSYYTPPEDALESAEAMRPWAKLAVEAARRAAASKLQRTKKTPKKRR